MRGVAIGARTQAPARAASRSRHSWVWAPDVRGTLCHRLIAELCARRQSDPRSIEPLARELLAPTLPVVHRQALLSFIVPMAASYLRHYGRPGWQFLGSEVIVDDVALDLLWQRRDRLEADEIKSSAAEPAQWLPAAEAQARAQADAARAHFGECFAGVRVVGLAVADTSVWVSA
jgi:hypothetical protein